MRQNWPNRNEQETKAATLATYFFVTANTLVFFAFESSIANTAGLKEKLLEFGALHPLLLWKGEVWRLLTAIFLHGSFLHFAFNTFVLLQVGRLYEPLIGGGRLLFLFLLTGVSGFALSTLTNMGISLGSSGAVFGLIGAMFGSVLCLPPDRFEQKLLGRLAFFVAVNLAFGFFLNQFAVTLGKIDNAAHIGGLIFGIIFGFALVTETPFFRTCPPEFQQKRQKQATGLLVIGLFCVFGLVGFSLKPVFLENYHETMGFDALLTKDFETAKRHISWLQKKSDSRLSGTVLSARLAAAQGDLDKAHFIIKQALKSLPDEESGFWDMALLQNESPMEIQDVLFGDELGNSVLCREVILNTKRTDILNDCAWLFLMSRNEKVHDEKSGLELALKAVESDPKVSAAVLHTLAEAYLQNGRLKEALFAIDRALLLKEPNGRKTMDEQKRRVEALMRTSGQTKT